LRLTTDDRNALKALTTVVVLLLVVRLLPLSWQNYLTFETYALQAQEWWRLLTGQLVHLRWSHLGYNLLGLGVIGLLFSGHISRQPFYFVVLFCMFGSNLGMWLFDPDIHNYVGFSGALYGLFAWGATLDVLQKQRFGVILLAVALTKTTYDYVAGQTLLSLSDATAVAYSAHFYGVLTGISVAVVVTWLHRLK